MEYITAKEAAEKWGISQRRVQVLCEQGRVSGAVRLGWVWAIPKDAQKPADSRYRGKKHATISHE
ncbi:MAG: DNA-binding protein [Firmicutes bacterium]|nr:DNA-binding protein [Bacillota bacterium]